MKLVLLLVLAGACQFRSLAPWPDRREAPLPSRNDQYTNPKPGTRGDVATDTELDLRFRSNVRDYGYLVGVRGVDELRYPESQHPDAAFAYVRLGDASATRNEWGAAAQAYWGALGLSSKTIASRRQREEIRRSAYLGLARVADHKQQAEWAALLRLCAGLADVYAQSEAAEVSHDELYHALETQLRAQREAEAAQARAERAMLLQGIAIGVGAATTAIRGGMGQISSEQVNAESAQLGQELGQLQENQRQVDDAFEAALGAVSTNVGQLRQVVATDIPGIQAGHSFVARQVGWYLLATDDPLPYFDGPLDTYVRGRPLLRDLVERTRAAFATDEVDVEARTQAIASLALGILAIERHVAVHERQRVTPGPAYLERVCAAGGGAIECFLAAQDVCRSGAEQGCELVETMLTGAK